MYPKFKKKSICSIMGSTIYIVCRNKAKCENELDEIRNDRVPITIQVSDSFCSVGRFGDVTGVSCFLYNNFIPSYVITVMFFSRY